jgi:signal transduction histidine kinase
MQSLINNLLDFSRHSFSSSDFKKTDLSVLVKDMISDMELEIEKSKATVKYNGLPVIYAVPGMMQQLFHNLLSNALKFRREEVKPEVSILSEKIPHSELKQILSNVNGNGKNYYRITVSDNGIGFEKKHSQEIFKVFKRLHSYQEFEGTGVGLSICKKIVEKHGGLISADSEPDKGTTFTMILPETQPKKETVL